MTARVPRPVLVGLGVASQREDDPTRAMTPLAMMVACARRAGEDCGAPGLLRHVDHVAVPRGRWSFRNPARAIADAIGAPRAHTALATVGVLQQTLIGEACARIARGESHAAIIAGADCGHRRARLQKQGLETKDLDPTADSAPEDTLSPEDELLHPAELRAGIRMPAALYAIQHSAMRHARGQSPDAQRDAIAARYARFAAVAAANPHAWTRAPRTAAELREAGPGNAMIAFPYNRWHCADWSVDQGAALLLCASELADELGIVADKRIHPLASTETNHMLASCARADLHRVPGIEIAGRRALELAGLDAAALDLVDLYSSFPVAPEATARALGVRDDVEWTVTGGMSFAGGPFNNYVLQATARVAELLRAGAGRHAMVSSVSGVMTKHGFGVWSREAPMAGAAGFESEDVSAAVERATTKAEIVVVYSGRGSIAGFTVVGERAGAPRGVAFVDTADGRRAVATVEDSRAVARMQHEECCGRVVVVKADGTLELV